MNLAMNYTIDVHRHRWRIADHAVREVATALSTGMPVIDVSGYNPRFDDMTRDAIRALGQQATYAGAFRFPMPDREATGRMYDTFYNDLPNFVSRIGKTAYYLDFVEFDYTGNSEYNAGGNITHAHAVMWRHDETNGELALPPTLPMVPFISDEIIFTSTRDVKPYWDLDPTHTSSDVELAKFIYTKRAVSMDDDVIDFSRVIDISDVVHQSGPGHNDPVWQVGVPEPGTDMVFDANYADGLHTHYVLRPRREFWHALGIE